MILARFLCELEKKGYTLKIVPGGRLKIIGTNIPPEIVEKVSMRKSLLLEYLALCAEGRRLYDEGKNDQFLEVVSKIEQLEYREIGE